MKYGEHGFLGAGFDIKEQTGNWEGKGTISSSYQLQQLNT